MTRNIRFSDLDTTEQAKAIAKDYFRGINARAMAEKYGVTEKYVRQLTSFIEDREAKMGDLDAWLSDTKQRSIEEIRACDAQISQIYEDLDYCRERLVVKDREGNLKYEDDPVTGEPDRKRFRTVIRDPGNAVRLQKLLVEVGSRRSELLLLNGQKVDIAIKLQMAVTSQNILLDAVRALPPEQYEMVYRHLKAATEGSDLLAIAGQKDAIDVDFREVR